jgi:carbamoyltransferase
MNIISIQDGYNASASLMVNGKIILALQEERFNEIKNYTGYPYESIKYCLDYLKKNDLVLHKAGFVNKYYNPYVQKIKIYENFKPNDWRIWWKTKVKFNYFSGTKGREVKFLKNKKRDKQTIEYLKKFRNRYKNKVEYYNFNFLNNKTINKPELELKLLNKERLRVFSKQIRLDKSKIIFLDHHTCHAYYAYFSSDLKGKDCLISTIDGGGDGFQQTTWTVKDQKIKLLSRNNSCPLGKYWKIICVLLSLKPHEHEYKVMGLAPYAKDKYTNEVFNELKNLCEIKNFDILEKKIPKNFNSLYEFLKFKFSNYRFDAISGGIQKYTEYLVSNFIKLALKKSKQKNLVASGGLFMNIKLNKVISEIKSLKDMFISGSAGDESLSIGACYFMAQNEKTYPLTDLYIGYKEKEINLNNLPSNIKILKIKNTDLIVKELVAGKIVGMFNGRAEFGARALGNRSILARPDLDGTVKKINEAVKNRDFWMPFAVSILSEKHKDFIINKKSLRSPHMTIGFDTNKKNLKYIKSGTHPYDETVRPQILERNFNKEYYDLITKFYKITKIPALLNTSLNLHGKPTVNNLKQAIYTLKNSKLDCLVVNYKYILKKKSN